MALTSSSSPAIAEGIAADYPGTTIPITTDQRGDARASTPDLGAYEYTAPRRRSRASRRATAPPPAAPR